MSLPDEYAGKPKAELQRIMDKLRDELEEVEEEKMFVLGQTGYHLPGATVKKYEAEIESLKKRIEACQSALDKQ